MDVLDECVRHSECLGRLKELILALCRQRGNLGIDLAHVAHGLHDIARARLALRADHRGPLGNAAQCLTEVARTADERHAELALVDVIDIIGWRQDLALVDVVNLDGLEHLRLDGVADAALGHDRNGDGLLDALDHLRVAHARDTARRADVSRDALERHDGTGTGLLRDLRLLRRRDVHDDAALEHLGELLVEFIAIVKLFCHIDSSISLAVHWNDYIPQYTPFWVYQKSQPTLFSQGQKIRSVHFLGKATEEIWPCLAGID